MQLGLSLDTSLESNNITLSSDEVSKVMLQTTSTVVHLIQYSRDVHNLHQLEKSKVESQVNL